MTVIRPNSITGITSITALNDTISVYKSDGTTAGLQLDGVNFNTTGVSTVGQLNATTLTVNSNNYPSAGPLSNRNLIINGAMQVAQRGTSFTLAHDGTKDAYTLDRFYFFGENFDEWDGTVTQVSDAPAGFSNSLKLTTLTPESTVNADEYAYIQQRIEAQNLQHINNGTSDALPLKLSFWVKTSQTGTYGFVIYKDDNTARVITATYTTTTTDWEYKTIDIPGDTGGGGIDNNNGVGIRLYWPFLAGSNFTSVDSTSWVNYSNAAFMYGHAQNATATTASATWQITGVQLEVGTVATPFEHRSYGEDLALCQRYYQILEIPLNSYGAQYATVGSGLFAGLPLTFITKMRTAPTSVTYENISGTEYWVQVSTTAFSGTGGAGRTFASTDSSVKIQQTRVSGNNTPSGSSYYVWEASFKLLLSSEL